MLWQMVKLPKTNTIYASWAQADPVIHGIYAQPHVFVISHGAIALHLKIRQKISIQH